MRRANASSGRSAPPRKPIAQQHGLRTQVIDDVDGLQRVAVTMLQPVCRLAGHELGHRANRVSDRELGEEKITHPKGRGPRKGVLKRRDRHEAAGSPPSNFQVGCAARSRRARRAALAVPWRTPCWRLGNRRAPPRHDGADW